MKSHADLKE